MKTNASIKRHPITYRCLIIFSTQCSIALLVGNSICTCRRCMSLRFISRYTRSIKYNFSIFDHKHVLTTQIHFCIGITVVFVTVADRCLTIFRCTLFDSTFLDQFNQFICFLDCIHPPAIISTVYSHCITVRGLKLTIGKYGIIFTMKFLYKLLHLIATKLYCVVLFDLDPLIDTRTI